MVQQLEHEVRMLRELLASAEARLERFQNGMPKAPRVSVVEVLEETAAEEADRKLNHQSGCGHDIGELRKRFLEYLRSHGEPGQWLSRSDMCHATYAWSQFGKKVVDPLFDRMVAEGVIEHLPASSTHGRKVRLRQSL
jgi:hypothetical protein